MKETYDCPFCGGELKPPGPVALHEIGEIDWLTCALCSYEEMTPEAIKKSDEES